MKLNNIIFFDSKCLVCNRFAVFILKNNKRHKIKLAPLNGVTYASLDLKQEVQSLDSIILYQENRVLSKIDALSNILKLIGGFYFILGLFLNFVPRFLSNYCYDLFAKHRYKVFGKVEHCALIPQSQKINILD